MQKSYKAFIPERISPDLKNVRGRNLAETLALAAEYKIPYDRILESSSPYLYPPIIEFFYGMFYPLLVILKKNKRKGFSRYNLSGVTPTYKSALDSAVTDLRAGYGLGQVLEKHLRWWLPEYYIRGVQIAEDQGTLAQTLRQLAETISKVKQRRVERFYLFFYPAVTILIFFLFFSIFLRTILIKFIKITDSISEVYIYPSVTQFVLDITKPIYQNQVTFWFIVIQIPWIIYYFFFTQKGDWILIKMPLINRPIIRGKMIELVQSLVAYTKAGIPLTEALDMAYGQLPRCSLKSKLYDLKNDLRNGVSFDKSWISNFKNEPLSSFYIKSGFKNNQLQEYLEKLLIILHEEDARKHRVTVKIAQPALILISAFCVFVFVLAFFQPLIDLIETGISW